MTGWAFVMGGWERACAKVGAGAWEDPCHGAHRTKD